MTQARIHLECLLQHTPNKQTDAHTVEKEKQPITRYLAKDRVVLLAPGPPQFLKLLARMLRRLVTDDQAAITQLQRKRSSPRSDFFG